jgi:adhesin transport system membrane fusion protein
MPGMVAQVDILAGRKTVLDYIVRPVIKVKDEAFRE